MNTNGNNVFKYKMPKTNEETEITVGLNDKFELVIDGNITTGYNWFLENANESDIIVKALNLSEYKTGEYAKGDHPPGWCGGSGSLHFKFEAKTEGVQDLKFVYKQSWNNDVAVEFLVKVCVTANKK